jgi:ribonucleoside-diphosphate reductase beta chain
MPHASFNTTTRGLDRSLPPMLLFEKAKKYGTWNPADIDLEQDCKDWQALNDAQRDMLLRVSAHFISGEEAVTLDLLPLIQAIASEGRLEEEMFLTTFLWEEAKHVDFFNRVLNEVCGIRGSLAHYTSEDYASIIGEALPSAMEALYTDRSPEAMARASATYNMIVEGVLAETGYYAYFTIMDKYNIFPGQRFGITRLKLDESRHIAYGVYLLSRLMSESPHVIEVVEGTMNALLPAALQTVENIYDAYDPIPFDVTKEQFLTYAVSQFQKRLDRIQRAASLSIDEINHDTLQIIASEDA